MECQSQTFWHQVRCSALDLVKGIKETVNHECQGSVDAYLLAVLSNSISVCIHSSRREKVIYCVIFTEPYLWDLTFLLGTHSHFYEISNVLKTCRAQRRPWEGDKVHLPRSSIASFRFQVPLSLTMSVTGRWKIIRPHLMASCQKPWHRKLCIGQELGLPPTNRGLPLMTSLKGA